MFQVIHRTSKRPQTVYGVHKSGPSDRQTKFLVHSDAGWQWRWAQEFDAPPANLIESVEMALATQGSAWS